jgi:hypothetical protein
VKIGHRYSGRSVQKRPPLLQIFAPSSLLISETLPSRGGLNRRSKKDSSPGEFLHLRSRRRPRRALHLLLCFIQNKSSVKGWQSQQSIRKNAVFLAPCAANPIEPELYSWPGEIRLRSGLSLGPRPPAPFELIKRPLSGRDHLTPFSTLCTKSLLAS